MKSFIKKWLANTSINERITQIIAWQVCWILAGLVFWNIGNGQDKGMGYIAGIALFLIPVFAIYFTYKNKEEW